MLKIKSNTTEFTIIFSEKIRRKIHAEKLSVQPSLFSTLSLFQPSFSFSFSAAHFFFFFLFQPFLVSASPFFCFSFFFFSFLPALLFFSVHVCLAFQPKAILSSAQKLFFQPKTFLLQPKTFFSSAQSLFFQFRTFLLQPKTFFNSAHITVSAPFCFVSAFFLLVGFVFSTPFLFVQRLLFFFLFQRLFLFFLPTSKAKNILFRCFTFLLFE